MTILLGKWKTRESTKAKKLNFSNSLNIHNNVLKVGGPYLFTILNNFCFLDHGSKLQKGKKSPTFQTLSISTRIILMAGISCFFSILSSYCFLDHGPQGTIIDYIVWKIRITSVKPECMTVGTCYKWCWEVVTIITFECII